MSTGMRSELLFSMEGIEAVPNSKDVASTACHSGMLAEMGLAKEAAARGFAVFFPVGHAHSADLVLWKPPARPISVQVKTATWRKGSFQFMACAPKPRPSKKPDNYGAWYSRYGKGDFDFLCAHLRERDEFVFYPIEDVAGKTTMRWRPGSGRPAGNWEDLNSIDNQP